CGASLQHLPHPQRHTAPAGWSLCCFQRLLQEQKEHHSRRRDSVCSCRAQQHYRSDRVHLSSTERHLPQERRGQEVALLLRLVLLLWRLVLHPGRDGGRPRRQHLHREEQRAALPLSHRPLQEHHARHASTAQLPLQAALPLQLALHRPAALAGELAHRRLQDLQPAALRPSLSPWPPCPTRTTTAAVEAE
ncbi:hypothetical protein E3U43_010487, partial [Larimichthys crocea]